MEVTSGRRVPLVRCRLLEDDKEDAHPASQANMS